MFCYVQQNKTVWWQLFFWGGLPLLTALLTLLLVVLLQCQCCNTLFVSSRLSTLLKLCRPIVQHNCIPNIVPAMLQASWTGSRNERLPWENVHCRGTGSDCPPGWTEEKQQWGHCISPRRCIRHVRDCFEDTEAEHRYGKGVSRPI